MKYIFKFIGKISILCYIFTLYQLWHLCQYGGLRSHIPELFFGGTSLVITFILWLISRRFHQKEDAENKDIKKNLHIEAVMFLIVTLIFGGCVVYSAIPYHGALSWKIDEWMRKKEVKLEHNNLFEDGLEGILTDLDEALDLPEELYIANKYQITFDENGTIQSIYTFLYGKDQNGEKKTYLVDYDADSSPNMTVWIDGNANGEYQADMRLSPMLEIMKNADWENQVKGWSEAISNTTEDEQIYELLYFGRRSFQLSTGLRYLSGDVDGDGIDAGSNNIYMLRNGGEIVGFEVSLHIPEMDSITPVRYIMEPAYISQEVLDRENVMQQVEESKDAESWTLDQSDGTMYFFLDDQTGWRLVVADAAAGSRFYVMEKTVNGGTSWERINADPFGSQLGVTEGLIFFDESFGIAGLTGASQSYSALYVTRDGGMSFEKIELPMDTVTQLPELADECGFTVVDYDYLHMPEKDGDTWTIKVTTEAAESDGIVFQSTDSGVTWEYSSVVEE